MSQIGGSDIFGDLHVDNESRSLLQTTTKWAKLTGVIGIISSCLSLFGTITTIMNPGDSQAESLALRVALIFVIPLVIVVIILYVFMLRFAASTEAGLSNMNQGMFNQGINFLKMCFKSFGVVIIVVIALFLIALIAVGIGASM
jgi:hypothetical protein